MKKNIIIVSMCLAFFANAQQQAEIVTKEFWKNNPSISAVKKEIDKGFTFKDIQGSEDPLFLAVSNNANIEIIRYLAEQPGVNLLRTIHEGRILLHTATNNGNAEIADYLISKGSDMNFVDANGHTPLSFTAFQGNLTPEMVEVFIKYHFNVKHRYKEKDGATLLLLAVGYDKDLKLTDYLLSKGLSLKDKDNNGKNAFFYASRIGNVPILKELVKRGVEYDSTALIAAAQGTYKNTNNEEVYQYLIDDLKLNPKITTNEGQTLLHLVTKKNQNQDDVILFLISKGADIMKTDKYGNTAFMNASGGKSITAVKALYSKGMNINAFNEDGMTALLNAAKSGTGEIVEFLIQNGADVNAKDKKGNGVAFLLADSYRTPRARTFPGVTKTPAAPTNSKEVNQPDDFSIKLKVLQANGIDFSKPFKNEKTVFHIAAEKNDINLMKQLSGIKADINSKDQEGNTPLHKAALVAKDNTVLKFLISLGADKSIKTEFGETAYDLAKENEFLQKKNIPLDFLK